MPLTESDCPGVLAISTFPVTVDFLLNQINRPPVRRTRLAGANHLHRSIGVDSTTRWATVVFLLAVLEPTNIVSGFVVTVLWLLVFKSKKENGIAGIVCHPGWLVKKIYLKVRLPVKGIDCLFSVSLVAGSKVSNSFGHLMIGASTL